MSTRANIIIKDGYNNKLYFYRHHDGYPEVTRDQSLMKFMDWLEGGHIRNNLSQAAGWLIILGAAEYDYTFENGEPYPDDTLLTDYQPKSSLIGWKVGAYEPTTGIHGDVEWIYTIDLKAKTLTTTKVGE